jgi:hypothetical protein
MRKNAAGRAMQNGHVDSFNEYLKATDPESGLTPSAGSRLE